MRQETLKINGMTYASCAATVEREIKKLEGIEEVNVNFATEKASIKYDPYQTRISELKAAIGKAGYKALEVQVDEEVDVEIVMINVLFEKGYELLKELGFSSWGIREQLERKRNKKELESDFSRYLVDMYNYSAKHIKNN